MQRNTRLAARRPAHRVTPAQEEYLLGIARLADFTDRAVPSCEIAQRLGWSRSSVCTMMRRLDAEGWLTHKPHRGIRLLAPGLRRARQLQRAQEVLRALLLDLGVPDAAATRDAAGLKHFVSELTVRTLALFHRHWRNHVCAASSHLVLSVRQ